MKLVIGNQKAYQLKSDVLDFIENTKSDYCKNTIICPNSIYLTTYLEKSNYIIGSQNVSFLDSLNTTGEVNAKQLKDLGVSYTIVGHSERRINQKEDSEMLVNKIKMLSQNNINTIFCVGESREEKNNGTTKDYVGKEILEVFDCLTKDEIEKIIIAYEPIWAISTGNLPSATPTNEEISDVVCYIKDFVKDKYEVELKVLYGGSVNQKNIDTLNEIDIVDGYLIGGASVKKEEFSYIMERCAN